MATFHKAIFPACPSWIELEKFLEFSWPARRLSSRPGPSQLRLHGAPSVCLRVGVKLEHFVDPLRVEGHVHEERRLRRGALGPLDAHAHDDFALVLLANQRAAVVFLGGGESGENDSEERIKTPFGL